MSTPNSCHSILVAALVLLMAGSCIVTGAGKARPRGFNSMTLGAPPDIISDDFLKHRRKGGPGGRKKGQRTRKSRATPNESNLAAGLRPTYQQVTSYSQFSLSSVPGTVIEQLGITLLRLRPAKSRDRGARRLIREDGEETEFVGERIAADTPIRPRDRVQLIIESPRVGYLYVIDRDLFADGSTGAAHLIFPRQGIRQGNNRVGPGELVYLPAQDDRPSYFIAQPSRADQVGELLSLIVTESPLKLPPSGVIPGFEIANWEKTWSAQSQRFEMVGGIGQLWTTVEKQAAAAPGQTRRLTQDEPSPQTIYHIATQTSRALLLTLPLRYEHTNSNQ